MKRLLKRLRLLVPLLIVVSMFGNVIFSEAQNLQTIAEARHSLDDTRVSVQGTIDAAPGVFDKAFKKFYIQDATAGIAVYFKDGGLTKLVEGDLITVKGKLSTFKGEREINVVAASDINRLKTTAPLDPINAKTGDLSEKNQGMLLMLSGKVTGTHNGIFIDDGSGTAHIYISNATGIKASNVQLGASMQIIGISSVFSSDYELLPRTDADITTDTKTTARERGTKPSPHALDSNPRDDQIEISAVYAATTEATTNEQGEAVRLYNSGDASVDLSTWQLTDYKNIVKLAGVSIAPHQQLWLAKNVQRFQAEFGNLPDVEYGQCHKSVTCLGGGALTLDNQGDEVALLGPDGAVVDTLVYGDGYTDTSGWSGPAVQHYLFASYVPAAGQIFYRKIDQSTCQPLGNTHSGADWAQDPNDPINGRHILYPGWSLDQFCATAKGTDTATTTFLVAPDNSYAGLTAALDKAQTEIDLELYFLTHPGIVDHLLKAQTRGVMVRALFDGDLSGGQSLKLARATVVSYQQTYWAAQEITAHGGKAYFWATLNTLNPPVLHRYNNDHQKFVIIDHKTAVISSENFAQSAYPYTGSATNTQGNRGAIVITDSPTAVKRLEAIFAQDADPNRDDVQLWSATGQIFVRPTDEPTNGYKPIQPTPLTITGPTEFEVVQSPETSLHTVDGLIGMVAKAGKGDRVLVEQQYEDLNWGSHPQYLNPRLQAYIEAARRGATVQIVLDGVNSADSNAPTVEAIKKLANSEHLAIEARITPKNGVSGNALHIKMVIITSGPDGYVHIGSINGSENSSRYNRELAIQVKSRQAFDYYAAVFDADWKVAGR